MADRVHQAGSTRATCVAPGPARARHRPLVAALTLLLLLEAPAAMAREWYRYRNEKGVVELGQTVPPHLVDRGYTVVDDSGRVLRVVPSSEERAVLEERRRASEAQRQAREAQIASDQELMRMYSSGEDVERARDRRLDSIRAAMAITQSNLRRLAAQKAAIEEQGRRQERSGRMVAQELVNNLKVIEGQIRDRRMELDTRRAEHDRVKKAYDANARRVRELYGQAGS